MNSSHILAMLPVVIFLLGCEPSLLLLNAPRNFRPLSWLTILPLLPMHDSPLLLLEVMLPADGNRGRGYSYALDMVLICFCSTTAAQQRHNTFHAVQRQEAGEGDI